MALGAVAVVEKLLASAGIAQAVEKADGIEVGEQILGVGLGEPGHRDVFGRDFGPHGGSMVPHQAGQGGRREILGDAPG